MHIRINGEPHDMPGDRSVTGLLQDLGLNPGRVAVEVNLQIIRKTFYDTCILREGDEVEIVNFVGGG